MTLNEAAAILHADWMWRPGTNSKQALVYDPADPTHPVWCEHRHRSVDAALRCADRIIKRREARA